MSIRDFYRLSHPIPTPPPDRTPSTIDVLNQVSMALQEGVSARDIAHGIFCSETKAFDVLLRLRQEGLLIQKSMDMVDGRWQCDLETKFVRRA